MRHYSILTVCIFIALNFAEIPRSEAGHFISINGMGGFAQSEFKNNVDNGGGLSSGYTYGFGGNSPVNLLIGGDLGFLCYGHESFTTPFSNTVKRVKVDVVTTNNILLFNFAAKLVIHHNFISPYTEARAGLSYLFTSSEIKDHTFSDTIASTKNFSDWTTNTAFGGGFMIPVYNRERSVFRKDDKKSFTLHLDFKFLYWWGGQAEYLKKGSISEDPDTGKLIYDVKKSRTDMTSIHIGLVFEF